MKQVARKLFLTANDIAVAVNVKVTVFSTFAPNISIKIDVLGDDGETNFERQIFENKSMTTLCNKGYTYSTKAIGKYYMLDANDMKKVVLLFERVKEDLKK